VLLANDRTIESCKISEKDFFGFDGEKTCPAKKKLKRRKNLSLKPNPYNQHNLLNQHNPFN